MYVIGILQKIVFFSDLIENSEHEPYPIHMAGLYAPD